MNPLTVNSDCRGLFKIMFKDRRCYSQFPPVHNSKSAFTQQYSSVALLSSFVLQVSSLPKHMDDNVCDFSRCLILQSTSFLWSWIIHPTSMNPYVWFCMCLYFINLNCNYIKATVYTVMIYLMMSILNYIWLSIIIITFNINNCSIQRPRLLLVAPLRLHVDGPKHSIGYTGCKAHRRQELHFISCKWVILNVQSTTA